MSNASHQPEDSPFSEENARFETLARTLAPIENIAPHQVLSEGVWLSVEEDSGAKMSAQGGDEGLRLRLHDIGRSRWAALAFTLPQAALGRGRYLGLLVTTRSEAFLSYRPCLRYLRENGEFSDSFTEDYIVSAGGTHRQMSFLPIDHERLSDSVRTEVHLFFQGENFSADIAKFEALLML